jgi:AraC-like DNA-binding protein
MNIVFEKILNDTLKFSFTKHGVFKSAANLHTDWLMPQSDVLAYIPDGSGQITFRQTGKSYCVEAGEAILSSGGKVRKNVFSPHDGKLVIYWIHLHYEILNGFNLLELFDFPKVFKDGTAEKIGIIIKKIVDLRSATRNVSVSSLAKEKAMGMELLALMAAECSIKENALSLLNQYRKYANITDYIESHLKDKITVADLAKISCLSVSRFHRVFKKTAGQSPTEFIIACRVRKAQSLLTTTDMSLAEIADNVGFGNVNYFSRIFKQHSGTPPAAYRNMLSNQLIL